MNKEEVKYKAIKKVGYGECFSDNINYIIENVDRWCGPVFDLYVDGVKVDNPKQYLEDHKPKEPQTLEEKIVDMCYKIDYLKEENKQLKDIRETAINYIDQVIMYKPCAREIDKELDTLIGILRGKYDE